MRDLASELPYQESEDQNLAQETTVARVLVIDDDRELCELVKEYLVQECFHVALLHDGKHGLEQALSGKYDAVILDVMLPAMNGLQVLQAIRRASRIGVLMLTARGEDVERIIGLEHGADDYLAKPFNPRELVARLRAVLRRLCPATAADALWIPERLERGDLTLDQGSRTCRVAGMPIDLTSTEFDLLLTLAKSSGRVLSRKDLVRTVLDREFSAFDRSIDVHISNLRKKLGALPNRIERIRSVRNIGYIYSHLPDQTDSIRSLGS